MKVLFAVGLSIASAVLVCGCGAIRYPNYYELSAAATIARSDHPPPLIRSVAVRQFDAPPFLRSGPIAYRESFEKLGFYPYDRWAVDPRRSATAAMIADLQATGIFQSVSPFDGRGGIDCVVAGTIERLEEVDSGKNVSANRSLGLCPNCPWDGRAQSQSSPFPCRIDYVLRQITVY